MPSPVTVTRHESVALVALNNPPVNALSHAVRVALLDTLKELFVTPDVDAIVIACEGRTGLAGHRPDRVRQTAARPGPTGAG